MCPMFLCVQKTKCASSEHLTHISVLPKKKDALALGGGLLTQTNKHKNYFFFSVARKNFLLYDRFNHFS
jgi:hypothetical protein